MNKVPFVYIENTLKCNLKCTMCSNPSEHEMNAMNREEILSLIDYFSKITDKIIFSGGESLMDPNIVEYVKRIPRGKEIVMLTNGTMFDSKNFEEVVPYLTELRVSIDDMYDAKTSQYRLGSSPIEIIEKMKKARKLNDDMIIVITSILNSSFVDKIKDFVDYFIEHESQVDVIRFIPQIYYKGRAPESIKGEKYRCMDFEYIAKAITPFVKDYIENKKYELIDVDIQHLFSSEVFSEDFKFEPYSVKQKCCEYQRGIFVNNNGDLIYCPNSQLPIVNIRNLENLDELVNARDEALQEDKHHLTDISIKDKGICSSCRYMKLCGGGCPAITYNTTNDVKNPDYVKCGFNIVWEKHILPLLPATIRDVYTEALDVSGVTPEYFDNIYEIVDRFKPVLHTEDYFGKGVQ